MKKKVIAFIFILCVIFSQYIYAYEDLTTEVIRQKQLAANRTVPLAKTF